MTEDEAKTKWCPFARSLVTLDNNVGPVNMASANRFPKNEMATCLGSGCMMWWRWGDGGYCGLAGEP
jgi:hypothetical protein